jgi:hypothetical protein
MSIKSTSGGFAGAGESLWGGGRRAASIAPPTHAAVISEYPVLHAICSNRLLDLIQHFDSPLQTQRTARLVVDLAAITSTLTMAFANLLFHSMSGDSSQRLQQRFGLALQAVDIINDFSHSHSPCATDTSWRSIATLPPGYSGLSPASEARKCVLQTQTTSSQSSRSQRCLPTRHLF